ncbi:MAG: SDR family oxidoreductase [Actinobacteria bacterium]|nr:SDR family oxidoreductase [Actinomycetota bacterium]
MSRLCLVTGATGYVGGRLVPELIAAGHKVRILVRHPERVSQMPWRDQVEIFPGDANNPDSLSVAMQGVDVAYYMIHSIGSVGDFEKLELETANTFATCAKRAGVQRIVYLGGLQNDKKLSKHLRSRAEVGNIFLKSGVPTIAFGAAVILGSGSLSFEMLRYLTERLPAMITPRWVRTRIQPIAIRDVLRYLVEAASLKAELNRTFDIGGPDVLTYEQMMQGYAKVAGLRKRIILPINLLSPGLSSRWIGLVTPVPKAIARPLVDSLKTEVVCAEDDIKTYIPDPPEGLLNFEDAVRLAVQRVRDAAVTTRWSSASMPGAPSDPLPTDPAWAGGSLYTDEREVAAKSSASALWQVIERIGGENGWYSFPLAWETRGLLDRIFGGPGLRRGRRNPDRLVAGETVDFWRVEECDRGHLLRLRAEMKMPGLAWLELEVRPQEDGSVNYHQRAIYHPRGLAGHIYWWSVWPFHGIVFGSMVKNITQAARNIDTAKVQH